MRNHQLFFAALSLTALAALVAPAPAQQEGTGQMPMQGGQMMQQTPMHPAEGLMPMARPPATPKSKLCRLAGGKHEDAPRDGHQVHG